MIKFFIISTGLILSVMQAYFLAAAQDFNSFVSQEPLHNFAKNGSCENSTGYLDLEWLMTVEQTKGKFTVPSGIRYIEIDRDYLLISDEDTQQQSIINIATFLMNELSLDYKPDILMKLAFLNEEQYIYWKQTYLNKSILQGLLSVQDKGVFIFCSGETGTLEIHTIESSR